MMSKKVLIVEDNELNMKLFHDLLESQGYETLQTREGLQAMSLARQHMPDLILMDIQLPEISGLEVTKWLKDDEELAHIPIIAVTAFAMKGDEERIRQGGCEAYISKPISVMHFLETVRKHLGLAPTQGGLQGSVKAPIQTPIEAPIQAPVVAPVQASAPQNVPGAPPVAQSAPYPAVSPLIQSAVQPVVHRGVLPVRPA